MSKHYQRPAIIIVEDAPDMRILVQRLIHGLTTDFDLIAVDQAAKALGHLDHRIVPLLITDYAMPEMDGLELTRMVKSVSPATTVLLITAHSSSEVRAQAHAAGADYFLARGIKFCVDASQNKHVSFFLASLALQQRFRRRFLP